jgi:hypothetical protein
MVGAVLALVAMGGGGSLAAMGGGPLHDKVRGDCISREQRSGVENRIREFESRHGGGPLTLGSQKYAFFPQAGTLWQDLFVNNFVDKNPGAGILDWDCTNFTYDGHRGHDVDLKTFSEQEVGVPIFAVLPGIVVDADDGHPDHSTAMSGLPANYVVLNHGGAHYTYYWHMRNGSVAVQVGQQVAPGTQLGLTASSGNSTGPHLHFETWQSGTWIEPSSGPCNNDESNWVQQVPIRRDMYLRDMNFTPALLENELPLPWDKPRMGTYVAGVRGVSWWLNVQNLPANSTWRVRLMRPNGTQAFDSGTANFNNGSAYRWSWWWWRYNFDLSVGEWKVEIYLNGTLMTAAPITVVATAGEVVNRPPNPVRGSFDPPNPRPEEVVFCRVNSNLVLDDPDYDVVRYRYRWYLDGRLLRDVVSAGLSDALPPRSKQSIGQLSCLVEVGDGKVWRRGFTAVPLHWR